MNPNDERKRPDIIYVDAVADDEAGHKGYEEQRYWSAMGDLKKAKFPAGLRVLGLIVGIFTGMVAAIGFIGAAAWFIFSLVTLRQLEGANAQAAKAWKLACKCTVITLGSFLTIFSPPLGIGLIILYFMMNGEEMNKAFVSRFSSYSPHQN